MKIEQADKVAKALNTSILAIRAGLEQDKFPFGTAIKCDKQYVYILYPVKVKEYIGIDI